MPNPTCASEYAVYTFLVSPPSTSWKSSPTPWRRLVAMLAPGDWLYTDAHYLAAEMEVDAEAARRWLPRPLRLASPARATVFVAWFPHTSFGSVYSEAGLFLHLEHRHRGAVFSPWMIVDDDVALILGRELLGYPKKMGSIALSIDGDRVSGVASRRGVELIRMEGRLDEREDDPPPMLGRPHRNVRSTMGLSVPKIIAFTPREQAIEVRRDGCSNRGFAIRPKGWGTRAAPLGGACDHAARWGPSKRGRASADCFRRLGSGLVSAKPAPAVPALPADRGRNAN